MQYPAKREIRFGTFIIEFLDGTQQRFRDTPGPLHQWVIKLDLLDDEELSSLDAFFLSNQGHFGSFSFTDPWDGTIYPNCSLKADVFDGGLDSEYRGEATLTVQENRS